MASPVDLPVIEDERGVDYVVVEGMAAVIHGSSLPTRHVDVVPSRDDANLDRLARALHVLSVHGVRLGAILLGGEAEFIHEFDEPGTPLPTQAAAAAAHAGEVLPPLAGISHSGWLSRLP